MSCTLRPSSKLLFIYADVLCNSFRSSGTADDRAIASLTSFKSAKTYTIPYCCCPVWSYAISITCVYLKTLLWHFTILCGGGLRVWNIFTTLVYCFHLRNLHKNYETFHFVKRASVIYASKDPGSINTDAAFHKTTFSIIKLGNYTIRPWFWLIVDLAASFYK